jgi:hypothetical protein
MPAISGCPNPAAVRCGAQPFTGEFFSRIQRGGYGIYSEFWHKITFCMVKEQVRLPE